MRTRGELFFFFLPSGVRRQEYLQLPSLYVGNRNRLSHPEDGCSSSLRSVGSHPPECTVLPQPELIKIRTVFRNEKHGQSEGIHHQRARPEGRCGLCSYCPCPTDGVNQQTATKRHSVTSTVLYCAVLYCTVLCYTVLYCAVLYCAILCCAALYCTVLCCAVLYCTVLCCTYCTVL